jgi:endonuclease/exonuclease/phosphatase family metal-dependent hydrolase
LIVLVVVLATAAFLPTAYAKNKRSLTAMTYNLYFGADLGPVVAAADAGLAEFIGAASQAWVDAHATDFAGRMEAVADQISEREPDLVGLQEVAQWRTGQLGHPDPAETVDADFLELLLAALEDRGLDYDVVAAASGFDIEAPLVPLGFDGRLTISDVLIARRGLPASDFKLSNPQTGSYATFVTLPTAEPLPDIEFPRQWASVDVKLRGKSLRFVTTHLESVSPPVRVAQAEELLAIHEDAGLPLVFVGDFNSEPGGDAAAVLIGGTLDDTFAGFIGGEPTCCQNGDVDNPVSELDTRIDLILADGDRFTPIAADVVGDEPDDRTVSGRWPSDHAGVVGELLLAPKG